MQTLRHEHLSALLLQLPAFRSWLVSCVELDLEAITGAVLSPTSSMRGMARDIKTGTTTP
ncbi:MAG: hypothetical protein WCI05_12405 [Myxococcales bacterium]